jgi:hypothetical protein
MQVQLVISHNQMGKPARPLPPPHMVYCMPMDPHRMCHPCCSIVSSVGKLTRPPATRPGGQGSALWTGRHCSTSRHPTLGSHHPSIRQKPGFYRRRLNWPLDYCLMPCFWMHGAIPVRHKTSSRRGVELCTGTSPLLLQTLLHTCEAPVSYRSSVHESTLTLLYDISYCWHFNGLYVNWHVT